MVCCDGTIQIPIQTSTKDIFHIQGRALSVVSCYTVAAFKFYGHIEKKKKMTPIFSGSQNSLHEKVEEAATDKTV